MQKQHRLLPFVLVALVFLALAQPIALMAQTEPTPTPAQPAATSDAASTPDPAAATPGEATATPDPAAPPVPRVHVVVEGENLTTIAADYGVTVEDILAINNLANGDLLQLGQELIIPGGTGEAIATVYTIGAGDTLAEVAAIFNTTLADVVATNRLVAADLPLIIGQTVPVVSRTGSALSLIHISEPTRPY